MANFIRGQYMPGGGEGCEVNKWNNPPYAPGIYQVYPKCPSIWVSSFGWQNSHRPPDRSKMSDTDYLPRPIFPNNYYFFFVR